MEHLFDRLIDQLNSSIFLLLGISILVTVGIWRLARLVEQFSHHKTKIDKVDGLGDRLMELKIKVDLIYQNTNPNKTVAAMSPISITPSGKEISTKIQADQILTRYLPQLNEFVEAASPKTAYDVQVVTMSIAKEKMMNLLNADEINAIKGVAYSKGLLVEDIMSIFGVLLRDDVLKRKGWPVADVDRTQKRD
jgi:hypothetical protein